MGQSIYREALTDRIDQTRCAGLGAGTSISHSPSCALSCLVSLLPLAIWGSVAVARSSSDRRLTCTSRAYGKTYGVQVKLLTDTLSASFSLLAAEEGLTKDKKGGRSFDFWAEGVRAERYCIAYGTRKKMSGRRSTKERMPSTAHVSLF